MKNGIKLNTIIGANIKYDEIKNFEMPVCFTCLQGRMKTEPTPKTLTNKDNLKNLEIICTDLKGPFPTQSVHHNKWFILFVCAKTNFIVVYFMKKKSETLRKLRKFKLEFPDLFDYKIKTLQCDEDKMFVDKDVKSWCLENKIKLQTSPPYHHESNGLAERTVQSIMDKTRTIMIENAAPANLWEEGVSTAVYLLNRIPLKKLNWKTPFELIFDQIPDISHLVPFYSEGVYHLTHPERKHSLSSKGIKCNMVGYFEYGKNQYLVREKNGTIVNRRDVTFNEIPKITEENDSIDEDDAENLKAIKENFTFDKNNNKNQRNNDKNTNTIKGDEESPKIIKTAEKLTKKFL
jgi:transposase InsO family protein